MPDPRQGQVGPTVNGPADARRRGFSARAPLPAAQAWLDARPAPARAVEVPLAAAAGRVLARGPAVGPQPAADQAADDGWAVRAAESVGASSYDPVWLRPQAAGPLAAGSARLVEAGDPLPAGADAVLPFESAQSSDAGVEVIAAAAEGAGVLRAGQRAGDGAALAEGRVLGPAELGLLADLGLASVAVRARPRVRLAVAGARPAGSPDALGPMLRALVERDGGEAEVVVEGAAEALARAAGGAGPDLLLLCGRSGAGDGDVAAPALAAAGRLAFHGLALRPGGSAALGELGPLPVAVLPGEPYACLCAYELLAGRLVRRLAGRDPGLPHARRRVALSRKLVSAVGFTEVVPVSLRDGRAEPLAAAGLWAVARADGLVVVPEALEGHGPGAEVEVHLFEGRR